MYLTEVIYTNIQYTFDLHCQIKIGTDNMNFFINLTNCKCRIFSDTLLQCQTITLSSVNNDPF